MYACKLVYLSTWICLPGDTVLFLQIALKLLDCDFPDESVRGFATHVLQEIPDERLEDILLQLTQVTRVCTK